MEYYSITIAIPTYNAESILDDLINSIKKQNINVKVMVIDSSSHDRTLSILNDNNINYFIIDNEKFDHGGTRNLFLKKINTDFILFLTQDVILNSAFTIDHLMIPFEDDCVVAVSGRQLPHENANPLAAYARMKNYSDKSYITSLNDAFPKGIRKLYLSNSFCVYRTDILKKIGGFPNEIIFGEDFYIAAKMILAGYKIAYSADACVKHSHNFNLKDEFARYFDIGVFHKENKWILESFGSVEGEGINFAIGQIKYLISIKKYDFLVMSILSSLAKYIGYKMGKNYKYWGRRFCKKISMNKKYWN